MVYKHSFLWYSFFMHTPNYMTGAELEAATSIHPDDVIASLNGYVVDGGDIHPTVYDQAISRCEPPMDKDQLQGVIDLCVQGIADRHRPQTPIDYSRQGHQEVGVTQAESHFAALLGATSIRLREIEQ
jgi:hypothetical protein